MQNNDLLGTIKQTNAPLFSSLLGVKKSFQHRFGGEVTKGFDVFPLVPHDAPKDSVRSDRNKLGLDYPYAYWQLQDISLVKEEQNIKNIRRHGSELAGSSSNTSYAIGYFFPAILSCNLIYETNQLTDAFQFMERWLILMSTEALNLIINFPIGRDQATGELNLVEWTIRIYVDSNSISFPQALIDSEESPFVFRYELPFLVRTKIGTHKQVAKFNNEGTVTYNFDIE